MAGGAIIGGAACTLITVTLGGAACIAASGLILYQISKLPAEKLGNTCLRLYAGPRVTVRNGPC